MKNYLPVVVAIFIFFFFIRCEENNTNPPKGNPPNINQIIVLANPIYAYGESIIICDASDSEDDNLVYAWTAESGSIEGQGDSIIWHAPTVIGVFTIKCRVFDSEGNNTSDSVFVSVESSTPIITAIIALPDTVETGESTILSCNAFDPDSGNLTYAWHSQSGSFQGTGEQISWFAPNVPQTYKISCTVTDDNGESDVDSINVYVKQGMPKIGLVAYYPFNGNANDESGNGNDASIFGASLTNDRFGNHLSAYSFDGVNDLINLNLNQISVKTIVFWFKGTSGSLISTHAAGDNYNNFFLQLDAYGCGIACRGIDDWTNNLCAGVSGDYVDGMWHFVTFTSDNGDHNLYVDGIMESNYLGSSLTDLRPYILGKREEGQYASFYSGEIDDVRIYNRILSYSEILILMNED